MMTSIVYSVSLKEYCKRNIYVCEERLAIRSSPAVDAATTGGSLGSGEVPETVEKE